MWTNNKGIIDGSRQGEKECVKPRAGDADLWIKIWEELHHFVSREIVVEVEHVKAHRTKTDKKDMSKIEKFVTEGSEKADEFCKSRSNVGRRIYGGEKGGNEASNGVVCPGQQVSMHEVCKEWQVHENGNSQVHSTSRNFWEHGESDIWEATIW